VSKVQKWATEEKRPRPGHCHGADLSAPPCKERPSAACLLEALARPYLITDSRPPAEQFGTALARQRPFADARFFCSIRTSSPPIHRKRASGSPLGPRSLPVTCVSFNGVGRAWTTTSLEPNVTDLNPAMEAASVREAASSRPQSATPSCQNSPPSLNPLWACPFHKADPDRFSGCSRKLLRGVHRVK